MRAGGRLGLAACLMVVGGYVLAMGGCVHAPELSPGEDSKHLPEGTLQLQALIDSADDGTVINIPRARYVLKEGLRIVDRRGLTLHCEYGTQILVDDVNEHVLTIASSSKIKIKNAYLRHLDPLEEYSCHGAVVSIENSTEVAVENSELNGSGAIGVTAANSSVIVVKDSWIHKNSFNAFYFHGCSDVALVSNIVEDNGNFMQCYDTDDLKIRDNLIRRNGGYWTKGPDPDPGPSRPAE